MYRNSNIISNIYNIFGERKKNAVKKIIIQIRHIKQSETNTELRSA